MRCIGMAERALELMISRVTDPSRRTFGKNLAEHGTVIADIATSRIEIDQARFLVLNAAKKIDEVKAKGAMKEISMAKVPIAIQALLCYCCANLMLKIAAPNMLLNVLDRAMQAHGARGISQDTPLAHFYASARTLRYADGPDEVSYHHDSKYDNDSIT